MQESRNWRWQLNGNTAEVLLSEYTDEITLTYKGYTASINVNEEEPAQLSWFIYGGEEPDIYTFGKAGIVEAITAVFAEIERRDAEILALEQAKQDTMQVLYRVFDELSSYPS